MMVYINSMHVMIRNHTHCCMHKKLIFTLPFTSKLITGSSSCLISTCTQHLGKDKPHISKIKPDNKKLISNFIHPSQMKETLSWEEKEVEIQKISDSYQKPETFKSLTSKQEQFLISKLEAEIGNKGELTTEEWDTLIDSVLKMTGTINKGNINAIVLHVCSNLQSLTLGKSFFKYLRLAKLKINRATYGNYLRLFYVCSSDCKNEDLKEIDRTYRELLHLYPLLDSYTAEKAVCALSITKHWQEYERLFRDIKMFYNPTSLVYSVVIKTAFTNRNCDLGWSLMEEMQLNGNSVPDEVFSFWLELNRKNACEALMKVLKFMGKFNIKPSLHMSFALKAAFENLSESSRGTFTTISKSGECRNCHAKLESASVSVEDYNKLKSAFLNPVLVGKDIFLKTKPEEFTEFLSMLEKTAPFDIVLDGLNIAFKASRKNRSPSTFAFQLKSMVKYFASQNKKVLVLGRKHMKKWPSGDMSYVFNNAEVFLAEDISQDDPFLLYAALYSGLGTCFVSQDMMRGHKCLLSDPKLQATFVKWQAQHQYFTIFIDDKGGVGLKEPVSFVQSIQHNSRGDWHIPYVVKENLTTEVRVDNYHRHWLCLTKQSPPPQPTSGPYERRRQPVSLGRPKVALKSIFDA
uniref:Mitochondrial ribonuclease P catalytic subunit n=1 Tax=Graphocephala atropunctata TaxID=36148 RepID=A0A1B6LZA4_9HEMI